MDDPNRRGYPGEEHHYSPPPSFPNEKIQHPRFWSPGRSFFITVTTALLAVIIILSIVVVHLQTTFPQTSPQHGALTAPTATSVPQQAKTASTITTPTSASSPTKTSGTLLCQPKASDWPQTSDWQTVGTEYVNKDGNATPIIAPCNIPVSDYSVEAQIRTSQSNFGAIMGVLARVNLEKNAGYKGGISYATFCGENCGQAELDDLLNSQQNMAHFGSLDPNTTYTVKLQVKGTDVTLYVNNNLVLEEHYTSANDAGQVGIECDQACEILQFTVEAQ